MSDALRCVAMLGTLALLLAGCGQTGELYLPEQTGEVVTRPTQTLPPEAEGASNSPQSVDSAPAPANPAPEVTAPGARSAEPAEETSKDSAKNPRRR